MALQWLRFILASLFMLAGLITLFAATLGLFRFHYVLDRIHVAAKCDTFGVLLTFASLMVILGLQAASLKLLLIIVLIWLANPVAGHLIAYMEALTNPRLKDNCEVIPYDPD
ncbi:MAG: monovalent cation/H(+) antiporter subunit G [Clostridiales bacterium]|nr:monovalent cation/H(+) antiporter subunit G [Clostridiales bacterium]